VFLVGLIYIYFGMSSQISLDLCLTLDITRSMKPYLEEVKKRCISLFTEIPCAVRKLKPNAEFTMRFSFIGYKDIDDDGHLVICPFCSDSRNLITVLEGLKADGGGDFPEDVAGALESASTLEWSSDYKVLLLVLDAPPHGSEYHDLPEEADKYYSNAVPAIRFVEGLAKNRVDFIMVRCGGQENLYTSKFASLCDFKYNEVWSKEVKKTTMGRVPFFKSLELDQSELIVSQFLNLVVASSVSSIGGQRLPSILDVIPRDTPAAPLPSAPTLPSVEQVFHSVEPGNFALFPDAFFLVRNSTSHTLQLLVSPKIPKHKRMLTNLALGVGLDGATASIGFAPLVEQEAQPTMVIPVAPEGRADHPHRVYPQTKKGVYVTVCRSDAPGYPGQHVDVGGSHIFVPRGANLRLYCL
jgi:hypothetical protein